MDIYIKSFNRPYLLDRSIASIYHFLNEFDGNVVVLDDGTPEKYLDKILRKYPEIKIIKSPYYLQKQQAIASNQVPLKLIPADFWLGEVLKGSEKFMLIEDDVWFKDVINYQDLKKQIYDLDIDLVKLLWLGNTNLISNNIVAKTTLINIVEPKVFTKNVSVFDAVFRTNKFKLGSIVSKIVNHKKQHIKYYQLYAVAGAVFSKKYYQICWNNSDNKVDELLQIHNILKHKQPLKISNFKSEVLKTTCKTTASLISKEHIGFGLDIFKINKILNEEWYNDFSYDVNDFANDIATDWIKTSILKHDKIQLFYDWEKWYDAFVATYKSIDCNVE